MIQLIKRTIQKIQNEGFSKLIIGFITYAYDKYYDSKYSLDTYTWVEHDELLKEDEIAKHASSYMAVRVLPLRRLFEKLKLPVETVFVDIGSGKGRILLVASEFGFMEVRGIEFSSNLCAIAEQNIANYTQKITTTTNFTVINTDASIFKFSGDESVFFLYNPFNEFILRKVIENISKSPDDKHKKVIIINAAPGKKQVFETYKNVNKIGKYNFWSLVLMFMN